VESSAPTDERIRCTGARFSAMSDVYPRQAELLEVNEADDGLVVYDPTNDMVHHLNPSAAMIFDLCDGARDDEAIAQILAEAYGLNTPPCDEVVTGLEELAERKLIHWAGHDAAT
jgi:hypothetical protein